MQDRFDYQTLWEILDRLRATHRLVAFADLQEGIPDERLVILRHDVDYLPETALSLAREEASRGIRATYFLLLNGIYYNLLDPRFATVASQLVDLGHEVGLHYDVNFLRQFPDGEWPRLMDMQAGVLATLSGRPVTTIAMHQPGLYGEDPLRHRSDLPFLNAYDDRFFRAMTYASDSCRAWRDATWELLSGAPLPKQMQLALHPLNWWRTDRDRRTIFHQLHATRAGEIMAAGEELMAQIERHQAVLEHTAREKRQR